MAILPGHIHVYQDFFSTPNFLADPLAIFGFQEIRVPDYAFKPFSSRLADIGEILRERGPLHGLRDLIAEPVCESYRVKDFSSFLQEQGLQKVDIIDLFDERANMQIDMNAPVSEELHEKYHAFIDIGCVEHLFDTAQCLKNALQMITPEGYFFLQTPVNGYFAHGFHVLSPDMILQLLELNGFEIVRKQYTNAQGKILKDPGGYCDVMIWILAKKTRSIKEFQLPQQKYWIDYYAASDPRKRRKIQENYWASVQ